MSVPNTFTPGEVILSSAINTNFSYLDDKVAFNSGISVTQGSTESPAINITATNGSSPRISITDPLGTCGIAGTNGTLYLRAGGAGAGDNKVYILGNGNVGFGAASPTARVTINSNTMRLTTAKTPASAADTGNTGDICWDSNYVYVCVSTNTWKRSALSTW